MGEENLEEKVLIRTNNDLHLNPRILEALGARSGDTVVLKSEKGSGVVEMQVGEGKKSRG